MKDAFIVAETHTVHINPAGIESYTVHADTQKVQSTVQKAQQSGSQQKIRDTHTQPCTHMHKNSLTHTQCCQELLLFLPGRVLKRLSSG